MLSDSAMILRLHIPKWQGRIRDKKTSEEVRQSKGAKDDAGSYIKKLTPYWLEKIAAISGKARTFHYEMTIPYDHGRDLLPNKLYFRYMGTMNTIKNEYWNTVNEFLDKYEQELINEPLRLGSLYNANDYPSKEMLRRRFDFLIEIEPVPVSDNFYVQMENAELAKVKKEMDEINNKKIKEGIESIWKRLAEPIKNMVDKLTSPDTQRIHGSVIGHIRDIVDLAPDLNVINDKKLADMIEEVRIKLASTSVDLVRYDEETKKRVVEEGEELLKKMEAYF